VPDDEAWEVWNSEELQELPLDDDNEVPLVVKLTLKREGQFHLEVYGNNHCSPQDGGNIMRFKVAIECYATDDRGFVYAQEALQEYFDDLGDTDLSCENLAAQCARELHEEITESLHDDNLRVTVELSPPPYAGSIEAQFDIIAPPRPRLREAR
jgi:hypothetical protein